LRIAVNQELEGLEEFFLEATSFLKPGGRIVAIAFHSLEDRIIKRAFRRLAGQCICDRPRELCLCSREVIAQILTPRPLKPAAGELEANPRARSARLRAIERV
jgi:16S rRNA (cytosine1402-N4)-methyltransferase